MFSDKKTVKLLLALSFGIVMVIVGFFGGIVAAAKNEWLAGGLLLFLFCGPGIFLVLSALTNDDMP